MGINICNLKYICGGVIEKQTIATLMNNNHSSINISQEIVVHQNKHPNNKNSNQELNYNPREQSTTLNSNINNPNNYNNFYFLLNKVTFLQRKIRSFLHRKKIKEHNITHHSIKEHIVSHHSIISTQSKKQMILQNLRHPKLNSIISKHSHNVNTGELAKNIKITDENESIKLLYNKHHHHNNNQHMNNFLVVGGTTLINNSFISNIQNPSQRMHTEIGFYSNSISLKSDEQLNQKEIKGFFLKKQKKYKYKGKVINRKKQGFGIVTWEDNSYLHATFENNKTQGFCKFHDSQTDSTFIGLYVNNRPNGYGIFYKSNKVTYEGSWMNNNLIGIGIEIWKDETYFQGQFDNSVKKGYGLYRWEDGSIYQGEWDNNQMNGIGMLIYSDERMYQGEFKNGIMDGFGEFIWSNEKKYVGYYKDNKKNGFGMFVSEMEPLIVYIGFWENGQLNGVGIKVKKGVVKYCIWKDGKKEQTLPGSWSISKYFNGNNMKYIKFFTLPEKDIIDFIHKYGIR